MARLVPLMPLGLVSLQARSLLLAQLAPLGQLPPLTQRAHPLLPPPVQAPQRPNEKPPPPPLLPHPHRNAVVAQNYATISSNDRTHTASPPPPPPPSPTSFPTSPIPAHHPRTSSNYSSCIAHSTAPASPTSPRNPTSNRKPKRAQKTNGFSTRFIPSSLPVTTLLSRILWLVAMALLPPNHSRRRSVMMGTQRCSPMRGGHWIRMGGNPSGRSSQIRKASYIGAW